jgi:hypothetical protein
MFDDAEKVPTIIAVMIGHSNRSDYFPSCHESQSLIFIPTE